MILAIKGHPTKGSEVIRALRILGGKDLPIPCNGVHERAVYYIDRGYICESWIAYTGKFPFFILDVDTAWRMIGQIVLNNVKYLLNINSKSKKK